MLGNYATHIETYITNYWILFLPYLVQYLQSGCIRKVLYIPPMYEWVLTVFNGVMRCTFGRKSGTVRSGDDRALPYTEK